MSVSSKALNSFSICAIAAALFSFYSPYTFAQERPPDPRDVDRLRQELQSTKDELAQTRSEVRELRRAFEELRGQFGSAAGSKPPSADASPYAPAPPRSESEVTPQADDVRMIGSELEQLHQTKVESASRYRVKLHGMVLLNAYGNSGRVDITDLPGLAFPTGPNYSGDVGFTLRQTQIGLEVIGPNLAGARTSAFVDADFFGGFPTADYGTTAGLVRLTTAGIRLDWKNTSVFAGQDAPFISPLSPTSFANLAQPAFAWSGNLWVWTPQVRVDHFMQTSDAAGFMLQAGILDPLTESLPAAQGRAAGPGEASRQPAVAGRVAWMHGDRDDPRYQFGVGGYFGRQTYPTNNVNAYAVTADWKFALGPRFAVSGEFYRGQAVGGLGGNIWTSTIGISTAEGLNGAGGWAQLKFLPAAKWELNNGWGEDNNFAGQMHSVFGSNPGAFLKNHSFLSNVIFKPRSNIRIAGEYRFIRTQFFNTPFAEAHHFNIAAGVSF